MPVSALCAPLVPVLIVSDKNTEYKYKCWKLQRPKNVICQIYQTNSPPPLACQAWHLAFKTPHWLNWSNWVTWGNHVNMENKVNLAMVSPEIFFQQHFSIRHFAMHFVNCVLSLIQRSISLNILSYLDSFKRLWWCGLCLLWQLWPNCHHIK